MPGTITVASIAALAALSAYIIPPIRHELKVLGVGRPAITSTIANAADYVKIEDTTHCEDLHYYAPANLLFTACEDRHTRFSWFPPLGSFEPPADGTQGSIHVVDPQVCYNFLQSLKERGKETDKEQTMKSIRLSFIGFDKTFVTHGIDVIADPSAKNTVYIFAVNHQPNPEFVASRREHIQKSNSRVELFRHVIGTSTAKHIRTISHPRVETPNDIYAISPTEFYVTNDHFYREGLMRELESVAPVKWSNTQLVSITDLYATSPSEGLEVQTALTGIKNNNGLGHVHESEEITVVSAERGILYRAFPHAENKTLEVKESIHLDSTLDNPTWYHDRWATDSDDRSGYILAGLARGIDLASNTKNPEAKDPVYVWLVQRNPSHTSPEGQQEGNWEKKLIFQDDGAKVRTASAAVVIGIDPKLEGGKKRGWLFVTGFMSENMVATKIDL
ncbi:serum paraoxonase/arylesterase family protein [Aureobasidium subglaciale]|nr:serum paraoxonase/arylesterase family protein [Aureobasidium subglaciale]